MGYPFNGVSTDYGETLLLKHLAEIKTEIETYYNKLNMVAFSPTGAHNETIPEKPAILEYIELIESSGHLIMPGGLMQQPHIFMREYTMGLSVKKVFDSIMASHQTD